MVLRPASPEELDAAEALIDVWLANEFESNDAIVDVTRDESISRRWYVRLAGEERDFTTIWMTLGQRTLKYESYVMPSPEENAAKLYEFVLRLNHRLVGAQFGIGPEDAIFLTGELQLSALNDDELDRIVGTIFEYVEQYFRPALRIGFASRFTD
ncbi:MAG: YbjN domain-containing protein [Actinomycetota bacterium]|jgi:hypothetical protein|nr:YbjN domain-containing protein [Actinomycetota bacterium]